MRGISNTLKPHEGAREPVMLPHPLDTALARRSNLARKSLAYALQVPRTFHRLSSKPGSYRSHPPVIVNSIPKSGTHLLMQIARALPRATYYGSFLAQTPSISLKRRTQSEVDFHLSRIVPGEVVGAHLFYSPQTSARMEAINALHLMIVRDPADILLSETHYLAHMNRFHRMAGEFRGLSEADRVERALNGSPERPDLYPAFAERIRPYAGWLDDPRVMLLRYEEFETVAGRERAVERILSAWEAHTEGGETGDIEAFKTVALAALAPEKSHTSSNREKGSDVDLSQLLPVRESIGYLSPRGRERSDNSG